MHSLSSEKLQYLMKVSGLAVLHIACYSGHMEAISNIIKLDNDIDIQSNTGESALRICCQSEWKHLLYILPVRMDIQK